MAGGALLCTHDDRSALTIGLKYPLGTELDAEAASLAPRAENGDVTSGARAMGFGLPRSLNGGSIRRFFHTHTLNLLPAPVLYSTTSQQRVKNAVTLRMALPFLEAWGCSP
jgi:hypothetical protein